MNSKTATIFQGAPPTPITEPAGAGDQLLYFTSSSLTADDRTVVFIREIDGNPTSGLAI